MNILNITLETELPIWFALLCALLGATYAFVLYRQDKTLPESFSSGKYLIAIMAFMRFATVSVIAFLLLSPLLKTIFKKYDTPIIIIAQDNSESIRMGTRGAQSAEDSAALARYNDDLSSLIEDLSDKYTVKTYSFGEKITEEISFNYDDKLTNISNLMDEIYNQYTNQYVGAIIIASDGIYNQGQNPLYVNQNLKVPIYTVALGDTTPKKDLILRKVHHNQIVYLGNRFSIHADIQALNCKDQESELLVTKINKNESNTRLFSLPLGFEVDNMINSIPIILEADETGIHHYRIELLPLEDEFTTENNIQDIFIEVLDNKEKILVLANSPHPDISGIQTALANNENYEISVKLTTTQSAFNREVTDEVQQYSLIILHQLPSRTIKIIRLKEKIEEHNIPLLFIIGAQTHIPTFNTSQDLFQVFAGAAPFNEAQPELVEDFTLFTLAENTFSTLQKFPPLKVPYGEYKVAANTNTLIYQKIGAIKTDYPLLIFNQGARNKIGVLCGEGIWRWRLYDYAQNNNQDVTNELISKIIQYLSVKEDKRKFRVSLEDNSFYENEFINFDAELYNDSYELINEPDITLKIINEDGKTFPFTFSKTNTAYNLNAWTFPVGTYEYVAKVEFGQNSSHSAKFNEFTGQFIVSPLRIEAIQTIADHQLLYALSEMNDGKLFYPNELDALNQYLRGREDIKPISRIEYKNKSLINLKIIFFMILFLFTVEWFLRKWAGTV
ncbi:MAG: VWA domain-containing protein [Bacteroidetes bacterium]|nr:VWA domain-containing protein [Bacteroidota bacterium]